MLLRFEVSNHRSIYEPIEFSMIAIDRDRKATRSFERLSDPVLTVAGIYGPNASGKSTVLDSLAWISSAIRTSLRSWEDFVPRDPHRFGKGPSEPSVFDLDIMVDNIRYEYHLEVDSTKILKESLNSFPERRRRMLFDRSGEKIGFRRGWEGQRGVRELITPTTLVLSAAIRLHPELRKVGLALSSMGGVGVPQRIQGTREFGGLHPFSSTAWLFRANEDARQELLFPGDEARDEAIRSSALALLQFADLGIDDVQFVNEDAGGGELRTRLQFIHRVRGESFHFEINEESQGTRTWFQLIGPALDALRSGRILVVDEIDASLHPCLSVRLLELFQDPETNPFGGQLIFSTHDTSLLNHLNRDEVWLTEKDEDGSTRLTALAEFGGSRVRKSSNMERAYLQGRFGAVPELDQVKLRKALNMGSGT